MTRRREAEGLNQYGPIPRMMPYKSILTEKYLRLRTQNLILDGVTEMSINRIGTVLSHIKETFVCD